MNSIHASLYVVQGKIYKWKTAKKGQLSVGVDAKYEKNK